MQTLEFFDGFKFQSLCIFYQMPLIQDDEFERNLLEKAIILLKHIIIRYEKYWFFALLL